MEHGISQFLGPPPFHGFLFLFPKLELVIEILDGGQRVINLAFNGCPELLLVKIFKNTMIL
jgi:hypothetical protein